MSEQEAPVTALSIIKQLDSDKDVMSTWSESKKKDFVGTMDQRIRAARYITLKTAEYMQQKAKSRKFLSTKHDREIHSPSNSDYYNLHDKGEGTGHYGYNHSGMIGGRSVNDLDKIAKERADSILKDLPLLKTAVQVIAPDVAKMLDRKEKLLEEGEKLKEQLVELSEPIRMSEVDQSMTIAQFSKNVQDHEEKRDGLIKKLDKIGIEGSSLEDTINKRLFAGLPGLSDSVIKVINDHVERSKALDQLGRRAGEKVLFGDSDAATDILKTFEKDELTIEGSIKSELAYAMEKLKLAVKKGKIPKELKGAEDGKTKKKS